MHFPDMSKYNEMKNNKLPKEEEVSEEEFIKLMIEEGIDRKKAKSQAKFSKLLGSSTIVGNRLLKVTDKPLSDK